MTFPTYEQSNSNAQPIGLYLFKWGNSQWAYTSSDTDQVVGGVTYVAIPISDDGLKQGQADSNPFTIHVPVALPDTDGNAQPVPVVALFRSTPPSQSVYVTVRRKHAADADAPIHWVGKIGNVIRQRDGATADLVCRNRGVKRAGLRLTWGRDCPHFLFDSGCALAKTGYGITRNVTSVTGNSFAVDGAALAAAPYYNGGFIEWDADGLGTLERRGIEATLGTNEYQIFGRADGVTVGLAVTLYPGCDGTPATCRDKFSNRANGGDVAFMPGKSPFDGRQVF
jgi:uncharacterized phage protein (TIGR02218 family)